MTPHFAGWTEQGPPGDWLSPTPIPFLTTAAGTHVARRYGRVALTASRVALGNGRVALRNRPSPRMRSSAMELWSVVTLASDARSLPPETTADAPAIGRVDLMRRVSYVLFCLGTGLVGEGVEVVNRFGSARPTIVLASELRAQGRPDHVVDPLPCCP